MKCPLEDKRFVCRRWLFNKLAQYLEPENRKKLAGGTGILIIGGPGTGKTAFCCEIASPTGEETIAHERLAAIHFCQPFDVVSFEAATFIRSLAHQLSQCPLVPSQYGRLLETDSLIKSWLDTSRCQAYPKEAIGHAICDPLAAISEPEQSVLLLIDAVDSGPSHGQLFSELVAHLATNLPPWVLLVCTGRKGSKLTGFRKLGLDDLRRAAVIRDVQKYILDRLDEDPKLRQHLDLDTAEMLNQLHIKSAGCILYLELVLDGVRDGFIGLREIHHIPGTLNGLYLWLCERLFDKGRQYARIRTLFEAMLASRQPIATANLFPILQCSHPSLSQSNFQTDLSTMSPFLRRANDTTMLFQPSFSNWLLDVKVSTKKFLCQPSNGHRTLCLFYSSRATALSPADIVNFAYHLSKSNWDSDGLVSMLTQSGAPVEDLVLNCPVIDEETTRILLDAGADFVSMGRDKQLLPLEEEEYQLEGGFGLPRD